MERTCKCVLIASRCAATGVVFVARPCNLPKPRNLSNATIPCFIAYHDECCFGLGYSDTSIASKGKKKEWTYLAAENLESNRKEIRQLKKELR